MCIRVPDASITRKQYVTVAYCIHCMLLYQNTYYVTSWESMFQIDLERQCKVYFARHIALHNQIYCRMYWMAVRKGGDCICRDFNAGLLLLLLLLLLHLATSDAADAAACTCRARTCTQTRVPTQVTGKLARSMARALIGILLVAV